MVNFLFYLCSFGIFLNAEGTADFSPYSIEESDLEGVPMYDKRSFGPSAVMYQKRVNNTMGSVFKCFWKSRRGRSFGH